MEGDRHSNSSEGRLNKEPWVLLPFLCVRNNISGLMVLRFGKTVDWTSRNRAIGRISLVMKMLILVVVLFFVCFFQALTDQQIA